MPVRKAYIDKMKAQLKQAEAEIERLKARAEEAEADVKLSVQQHVEDMQHHHNKTHSLLEDIKTSGEGAWEEIKYGVDAAWQDLRKSVENAAKHF